MASPFVDKVTITVRAGNGGNGAVTFHREKCVAAGGPDGGDGGRGGDIIFEVDDNMSTLMDFRYKRKYVAANGADGQNKRCSGRVGESLRIRVPRGTLLRDADSGAIMHDMSSGEPFVAGAAAGATSTLPPRRGRCRALPSPVCRVRATRSCSS